MRVAPSDLTSTAALGLRACDHRFAKRVLGEFRDEFLKLHARHSCFPLAQGSHVQQNLCKGRQVVAALGGDPELLDAYFPVAVATIRRPKSGHTRHQFAEGRHVMHGFRANCRDGIDRILTRRKRSGVLPGSASDCSNGISSGLGNPPCDQIRGTRGEGSNSECLDSAPHRRSTGVTSLDVAEHE